MFFLDEIVSREAAWIIQGVRDTKIVGVVGLAPQEEAGTVELGYWLGEPYWYQGFASEAARAVLGYAFEVICLPEVISGCFANNARSAHVLGKLGFRIIRMSTRACMSQAKELPHFDMVLTREVWNSRGRSV